MTIDLVERLRLAADTLWPLPVPIELLREAANEIERLEELLWQEAGNRVEIERLRAELGRMGNEHRKTRGTSQRGEWSILACPSAFSSFGTLTYAGRAFELSGSQAI